MMNHVLIIAAGLLATLPGWAREPVDPKNGHDFATDAPAESGTPLLMAFRADYAPTFSPVLESLRRVGEDVVLADPEAGIIATGIAVAGGFRQTGTRLVVLVSKGNYQHTYVEVMVTVQQRFRAPRREPWGEPSLEPALTRAAVARLRHGLGLDE